MDDFSKVNVNPSVSSSAYGSGCISKYISSTMCIMPIANLSCHDNGLNLQVLN